MAKQIAKYIMGPVRYEPNPSVPPADAQRQVYYISPMREAKDEAEEEWAKVEAAGARKKRLEILGVIKDQTSGRTESTTRYLVDDEGKVYVAPDGDGEYTYKDALIASASRKGTKGQEGEKPKEFWVDDDGVIHHDPENGEFTLSEARAVSQSRQRALVPKSEEPPKKKEFYVDEEMGMIVHDPEQGEFTLSEARAVSASRQRALVPKTEPITPEKLELLRRDIQDEWRKSLNEVTQELRRDIIPKEEEPAFITDDKGELQLNPKAKVPAFYLLLYQVIKQSRQDSVYRDSEGNVMRLPEFLEVKRFDTEEKRKNARNTALVELLQEGRKELPALAQGLRSMSRSREAEQAMKKGGWLKEEEGAKTANCRGCGGPLSYGSIPAIITCERCGVMNAFGSPERIRDMQRALAPAPETPEEQPIPEEAPTAEIKEEQKWQESATPPATSSGDTAEDTSKGESGPASRPTSKRSRKTGSAGKR